MFQRFKKIKIFPTKTLRFRLFNGQSESLNRLERRTEKSENLISAHTDKSFRGSINGNRFRIISSVIGKGAFCVMRGEIGSETGTVHVEIHIVFRILLSIFLCAPIVVIPLAVLTGHEEPNPILILVVIGQVLMIRYAFIGVIFKRFSKESLNRLRDVVDFEWIK